MLKAAREKQWITYERIPWTWPAAVPLTNKKRRKSIWQNPTPIYDRNSPESGHRGNLPQHTRGHIWQSQPLTYSNGKELKAFSPISETRMATLATILGAAPRGMWNFTDQGLFPTLETVLTTGPSGKPSCHLYVIQFRKPEAKQPEGKRKNPTAKGRRLSLFADDMILYKESLTCHEKTTIAHQWIW